jgi:mRNA-degrading endonuclease YafQ of YafQ-DinJ toxin-antitoxin module
MKIEFNTNFKKQFAKLPLSIQKKFEERFLLFCSDYFHPLLRNHSVHPTYTNARSINITGDYCAIYEKNEHRILFTHIGTHSKLYE